MGEFITFQETACNEATVPAKVALEPQSRQFGVEQNHAKDRGFGTQGFLIFSSDWNLGQIHFQTLDFVTNFFANIC